MTPPNQKPQESLEALQNLLEKLHNDEDDGVLHLFKLYLKEAEGRYYDFAHRMQNAWMITAIGLVLALGVGGYITHKIQDAATDARAATTELRNVSMENRKLINRLKAVANQAQLNGARADKIQCREIEKLKAPIREVLTRTGATKFLPLFKRRSCYTLPNAKPIQP